MFCPVKLFHWCGYFYTIFNMFLQVVCELFVLQCFFWGVVMGKYLTGSLSALSCCIYWYFTYIIQTAEVEGNNL